MTLSRRKRWNQQKNTRTDVVWVMSFTDLMLLLLAFFVCLVSISPVSEKNAYLVLNSVGNSFGSTNYASQGKAVYSPFNDDVINGLKIEEVIATLGGGTPLLEGGVLVRQTGGQVIISFSNAFLFTNEKRLTDAGKTYLSKLLPYFKNMQHPLLIAGHSASGSSDDEWLESSLAVNEVYRFLVRSGVSSTNIAQEAFGKYYPAYANSSGLGRVHNSRVELVIDKRNGFLVPPGGSLPLYGLPSSIMNNPHR